MKEGARLRQDRPVAIIRGTEKFQLQVVLAI